MQLIRDLGAEQRTLVALGAQQWRAEQGAQHPLCVIRSLCRQPLARGREREARARLRRRAQRL
jgi:hypothetical protein